MPFLVAALCLATPPSLSPIQVSRLAGLCKAWNYAKFFHFSLIEQPIDWDASLIRAIPAVESATTTDAYRQAVQAMLDDLKDPASRVTQTSATAKQVNVETANAPNEFVDDGGNLYLDGYAAALFQTHGNAPGRESLDRFTAAAPTAKSIVLDLRCPKPDGYETDALGDTCLDPIHQALYGSWTTLTYRYRVHHGYMSDTGDSGEGYGQTVEQDVPTQDRGQASTDRPVVFIVNQNTPSNLLATVLGAKQAGRCQIVSQGEPAVVESDIPIGEGLVAKIRDQEAVTTTAENLVDSRDPADPIADAKRLTEVQPLSPHKTESPNKPYAAKPVATYPEMTAPSEPYRLLALFRFWGVIDQLYPYKHLLDKPWDDVLPELIPYFHSGEGALGYRMAIGRMMASLHDSHGFYYPFITPLALGPDAPLFGGQTIGRKYIVTWSLEKGISPGDEILSMDGQTPAQRAALLAPFIAHSTPQALQYVLDGEILGGRKQMTVRLLNGAGQESTVVAKLDAGRGNQEIPKWTKPTQTLAGGLVGYIDLCRTPANQATDALHRFMDTRDLIIDLRGYPMGGGFALSKALMEKPTTVARFEEPTARPLSGPHILGPVAFDQSFDPDPGPKYKGRIVVLINNASISQSEHSCLMIAAAHKVTFVGSPTMGANGDVSTVVLPGNIQCMFTGHSVTWPDGRQLQRVGVQPLVLAYPTAQGLHAGTDEVLNAGLKFLGYGPEHRPKTK